ncbi:MAG TPA: dTMP kinase [Abditibacteriaceae bacterium]|nr:dTMP kinase [Abditibacteriaceae bacterium]
MSFLITFEGIDGCGKSTQLALLGSYLQGAGHSVTATREPGGTALAEAIRHYLLHTRQPLAPPTELLLFGAARAQHVSEIIRPALARGDVVLSDRFADSSVAYQGGGLGLDSDFIRRINAFATDELKPNLTILLDVEPEVGCARRATGSPGSTASDDRIEGRGLEFQRRVRAAYLAIACAEPARVVVVDGVLPIAEAHRRIVEIVQHRALSPKTNDQ